MEIDVRQIALQALNVGILFVILAKFLFKPLIKILDERAKTIEKGLQAAQKNIQDQEALEERKKEELLKAEKKAAEIIEHTRQESKELGKKLVEEAREEAQKAATKQEEAFLARLQDEETKLKARLGELVVATTKAVLKDTLSANELKTITKKSVTNLKKSK